MARFHSFLLLNNIPLFVQEWAKVGLQLLNTEFILVLSLINYRIMPFSIWTVHLLLFIHTHTHIISHFLFFILSSLDKHLGCLNILAITSNTEMNIRCIYIFELVFCFVLFCFSGKCPEEKLLDYMAAVFSTFCGISILFSIVVAQIYHLSNSAQVFPFLPILANTCL